MQKPKRKPMTLAMNDTAQLTQQIVRKVNKGTKRMSLPRMGDD
jgi:hypothetical protein